jgi:hypothetical protein
MRRVSTPRDNAERSIVIGAATDPREGMRGDGKEDNGPAKVDTAGGTPGRRRRGEEEEVVVEHDTANGDAGSMFANLRSGLPALMLRPLSPGNLVYRGFVSQS